MTLFDAARAFRLRGTKCPSHPPVAIGGIGGSGTRLVAEYLKGLGYYTGSDQNVANDNLWFTLLFKRPEIWDLKGDQFSELVEIFVQAMAQRSSFPERQRQRIIRLAMKDRPQHDATWLAQRVETLLSAARTRPTTHRRWGWKEPNTHIVVDRLADQITGLKYIHVVRNGLDMAFSSNQNQLRLWGRYFLDQKEQKVTPYNSLRFWHAVHKRVLAIGRCLGDRFLLLNFDRLCLDPDTVLDSLFQFVQVDPSAQHREQLRSLISPPATIGRYKDYPLRIFHPADVEFVKGLGFDTRPG